MSLVGGVYVGIWFLPETNVVLCGSACLARGALG